MQADNKHQSTNAIGTTPLPDHNRITHKPKQKQTPNRFILNYAIVFCVLCSKIIQPNSAIKCKQKRQPKASVSPTRTNPIPTALLYISIFIYNTSTYKTPIYIYSISPYKIYLPIHNVSIYIMYLLIYITLSTQHIHINYLSTHRNNRH